MIRSSLFIKESPGRTGIINWVLISEFKKQFFWSFHWYLKTVIGSTRNVTRLNYTATTQQLSSALCRNQTATYIAGRSLIFLLSLLSAIRPAYPPLERRWGILWQGSSRPLNSVRNQSSRTKLRMNLCLLALCKLSSFLWMWKWVSLSVRVNQFPLLANRKQNTLI